MHKLAIAVFVSTASQAEDAEAVAWVLYHMAVGVSSFVFVSNHCRQEHFARFTAAISAAACPPSAVILEQFRCAPHGFQTSAYRAAVQELLRRPTEFEPERTFVAFTDIDEYLVGSVESLFEAGLGDVGMWLIPSTVFGTSYREKRGGDGDFTPANFVMTAAASCSYCKVRCIAVSQLASHGLRSMHSCLALLRGSCSMTQDTRNVARSLPLHLPRWTISPTSTTVRCTSPRAAYPRWPPQPPPRTRLTSTSSLGSTGGGCTSASSGRTDRYVKHGHHMASRTFPHCVLGPSAPSPSPDSTPVYLHLGTCAWCLYQFDRLRMFVSLQVLGTPPPRLSKTRSLLS